MIVYTLLTLLGFITLIIVVGVLFINLSPQFGGSATKEQQLEYAKLNHYKNGKFVNTLPSKIDFKFSKFLRESLKNVPNRRPSKAIEVEKIDSAEISNHSTKISQLTWFGHSTFLLEIDGKKILIDPMFGITPAPHPWLGSKRYSRELPIEIEKLPFIDAVILSHDHYDHLDYGSIQRLKGKVGEYFTPLGVGSHLVEWGIPTEYVHELNWNDRINFNGINLICTPARHFSGRGLFDRASTLWCSWVIQGENENIFFSGDSGYGNHFKEIGEKYGPFDIALMECGQYNEDWRAIHMMPEETVQAAIDVNTKVVLPIHWGAFTLSLHNWTDPIERITKKAKEENVQVTTPKIGEVVIVGANAYPTEKWWENYQKADLTN